MRRVALPLLLVAASAGCVSVEGLPNPYGSLKRDQRLVVSVYPSPGPWIVADADSKAEAAAKITPLGFLVQGTQDMHTLSVSKNLQQYLPRPRLGLAVQESLLKALRTARSTDTVKTGSEAGIPVQQQAEWNKSKDQLDWRQRYFAPDPDQPPPRDYARMLTLDDALILDVNVSFGTDANDEGHLLPQMTASSRVYRGDTMHLLWEHEDIVTETTSSTTLSDYLVQPWMLTDSLTRLAPSLGTTVAASFIKSFVTPPAKSTAAVAGSTMAMAGNAPSLAPLTGGLVPMSFFQNAGSPAAAPGVSPSTAAASSLSQSTAATAANAPAFSSAAIGGVVVSSVPAASPQAAASVSTSTAAPAAISPILPSTAAASIATTPPASVSTTTSTAPATTVPPSTPMPPTPASPPPSQ